MIDITDSNLESEVSFVQSGVLLAEDGESVGAGVPFPEGMISG